VGSIGTNPLLGGVRGGFSKSAPQRIPQKIKKKSFLLSLSSYKTNPMKKIICAALFALIIPFGLSGQRIDKLAWYGIDFSAAKFILVSEPASDIVNRYMPAINTVVLAEPEKYDVRKYFGAREVEIRIDAVTKNNAAIDPSSINANSDQLLEPGKLTALVKNYAKGEPGTGLVFIAENLNKVTQTGTFYVCLFDTGSGDIIDMKRLSAKAAGFGFRNYWASSVYKVMMYWGNLHGVS
jgi:hypothetical protein